MIQYPFDLQIHNVEAIRSIDEYATFLKTAVFEEKIATLSFLLTYHEKFEKEALVSVLKEHYPVSYFIDLAYNTSVENYFSEGKAGVLFLIFKLAQLLPDVSFTEVIESFLKAIIFQLRFTPVLCHHDDHQQQSPVGFSKGNSGIAYALVLLSDYFKNRDIALLAKGLIAYEDVQLQQSSFHTYLNPAQSVADLEAQKTAYLQKDTAFFTTNEQELTAKDALQMFYTRIELFRVTAEAPNIQALQILADVAVNDTMLQTEHKWCIAVLAALDNDANYIPLPKTKSFLNVTRTTTNDFTYNGFVSQQITIAFRRTIVLFTTLEIDVLATFEATFLPTKNPLSDFFKLFYEHCHMHIHSLQKKHQEPLLEILEFEYDTILMQQNISNHVFLQLEDIINVSQREKLLMQEDAIFFNTTLRMNPSGKLVKTSWNWVAEEIFERLFKAEVNLEAAPNEFYCYKIPLGVLNLEKKSNIKEVLLSEYEYIVLDLFEFPVTVADVIKEFSTIFDVETQEDFQRVRSFAKEIIKTLVFKKCLIL